MTKKDKVKAFNPNDPGDASANLFGLPFTNEESDFVVLPLPWEVTVSYGAGTAAAPAAVKQGTLQVDLFAPEFPDLWKSGIGMLPINKTWKKNSKELRKKAETVIAHLNGTETLSDKKHHELILETNHACANFHQEVYKEASSQLKKGKTLIGLGGDHSTPFGIIRAYAEKYPGLGILHFDAHCDLRVAYEGFTWSHASVFYNVLEQIKGIARLTQVGIRDLCKEEADYAHSRQVKMFTEREIRRKLYTGVSFKTVVDGIVSTLPENVYVSFDVDALDQRYCPGTGTPVPGGLDFEEALYFMRRLVDSGRRVVGFDINESGTGEWDANVTARLLYQLCGYTLLSQKKAGN